MVQLIVGNKGKGKTKELLDKANAEVKEVSGNIVYLDKSSKHMFELNNKIRLIDVPEYMVESSAEFLGFVSGIISQDHDLEKVYLDSVLTIACIDTDEELMTIVDKLERLGKRFDVDFVLSVSRDEEELPESLRAKIVVSL